MSAYEIKGYSEMIDFLIKEEEEQKLQLEQLKTILREQWKVIIENSIPELKDNILRGGK